MKPNDKQEDVASSENPDWSGALTVETLKGNLKTAYEYALDLHKAGVGFVDSYRRFCVFARSKLLPKEIGPVLKLAGFNDSTISRIRTVCGLDEASFAPYQQGQIGFNATLEKAREAKSKRSGKARKLDRFGVVVKSVRQLVAGKGGKPVLPRCQYVSGVVVLLLEYKVCDGGCDILLRPAGLVGPDKCVFRLGQFAGPAPADVTKKRPAKKGQETK